MITLSLFSFFRTAVAVQDTAASGFAPKWQGAEASNSFITMMASHDLIFVVLAVSLIIWFVLLFFIIRTDLKVNQLEKLVNKNSQDDQS